MKINYVSKKTLFPAFGRAFEKSNSVKIRNDLPNSVKKFVVEHEKFHLKDWSNLAKQDKKYNWIIGELKANFFAVQKYPFGFVLCVAMSLAPARLKFYFNKFKTESFK